MKIAGLHVHPLADVFPLLEGDELEGLVDDIRQHGLRTPITLFEGKILDGRNRARACKIAKVRLETRIFKGKDPLGYVVSMNLARRHLDESQRAMVGARLAKLAPGRPSKNAPAGAVSQDRAARSLNVSRREVQRAKRVLEHAEPELVRAVDRGLVPVATAEQVVKRPKREQRALAKAAEAGKRPQKIVRELHRQDRERKMTTISKGNRKLETTAQYGVILADPPWQYDEGTTTPNRRIDNQYPVMPLDQICALDVKSLALEDCVLYLWIPSPLLLSHGPAVLEAWGFDYKSQWIWHKTGARGTGYWAIVEHEHVLICTRGNPPPPAPAVRFPSVFDAPRTKHSQKPGYVYRRIEQSYPEASRIELFAREAAKGWAAWGNQARGTKT